QHRINSMKINIFMGLIYSACLVFASCKKLTSRLDFARLRNAEAGCEAAIRGACAGLAILPSCTADAC
ncbi:hypothetical protein, partial [Pseudomonas lopnurensis]|uniref:hypothetical protein n=1 Tax=Pseudomonas lopnurensis TaxID=1477517 RepID=UPI0028A919BC